MTTGELFSSHSTAPSGSTALYNLETLCQDGGCGEWGLIPITDIECNIVDITLDCDLTLGVYNCDLQTTTLNAILSTSIYSADLTIDNMEAELCQQQ